MSQFISGLNHLGLIVKDIAVAKKWFVETLQLEVIEDRGELLFLRCGKDVLAIKTPQMAVAKPEHGSESQSTDAAGFQALDHYGFFADSPNLVDEFAKHVSDNGASVLKGPYDRSDGRSVYFKDPLGYFGEYLYFEPGYQAK